MNLKELEIVAISHSVTQSHNYAVVLGEVEGNRRLPIVIGGFEAQAIAVALEDLAPSRPLTHDLFKNTLTAFDINLKEIVINNLLDGIFYSKLVCERDGRIFEVDSRTSDAIAMAVRYGCPIYAVDYILDSAGIALSEEEKLAKVPVKTKKKSGLSGMTTDALEDLLQKVLANEDYEKAAKIRDELNRRKSGV